MSRVYGANAVGDLLARAPNAVTTILVAKGSTHMEDDSLVAEAERLGIPVRSLPRDMLKQRAGGRGGVRIAAEIRVADPVALADLVPTESQGPLVVMLDSVTDPHNLGAIIRSAAAFSVDAVIVGRDRAAPLNDAAVRASAGAVAHVPLLRVANLARALSDLKAQGIWVYTASASAELQAWEADLVRPLCLVLGAEGKGIRPRLQSLADQEIAISLSNAVASLNVSVSAGILLGEVRRQHALLPPSTRRAN